MLRRVVASLSAITVSERGDYDGRIVDWLSSWLMPRAPLDGKTHDGSRGRRHG